MQEKNYTLGLDLGIASVGAALLTDNKILGLHVRTFDKAENAKDGESLNLIRREARSSRRRLRRRAHRLLRLCRLLKREGLIDHAKPDAFRLNISPWQLRSEGLDRLLDKKEWATVLYHIVKHRGFQSNRKSELKDKDIGKMLSGVSTNKKKMEAKNYRTIGEMFYKDDDFYEAKRNKGGSYRNTVDRADLQTELKRLFEHQREQCNRHTSAQFLSAVDKLLMARRPTFAGDQIAQMVGKCTFEPSEYRAAKACHSAERFIWYDKLNNMKIGLTGERRPLTLDEKRQLQNSAI